MYLLAEMEIGFSEMEKHSRHYTVLFKDFSRVNKTAGRKQEQLCSFRYVQL